MILLSSLGCQLLFWIGLMETTSCDELRVQGKTKRSLTFVKQNNNLNVYFLTHNYILVYFLNCRREFRYHHVAQVALRAHARSYSDLTFPS